MAEKLDSQRIDAVFQSRPDIIAGIKRAADSPGRIALFNEITSHVYEQLHENGEPAQKRRKLGSDQQLNGSSNGEVAVSNAADEAVLLEIKEISVSIPLRKKLELCFTANHLYARAPGTTAPLPTISYAWRDIEYAFYLPVPDKAQVQHNYVLFPRGTCLPSKANPPTVEPLVFTVPSTAPKQGTVGGSEAGTAAAVSDTYKSLFHWALERRFKATGNSVEIVSADPNKFHSMVRQPHRPNEKAVHVSGFRGSKDGSLFFLENGILWGFKKPLIFIPVSRIAAISYTNILQITFNMVVEVFSGDDDATEELEFGMLDQQDYAGIDNYVKMNRLQDRSMAEQRKAKLQLAENKGPKKNADGAENGDGDAATAAANGEADDMTELERAQLEVEQQLQDDEDEDEEDYDPGSEGESEGSGSSSDEDDDDDDDDDDGDEELEEGEGEEDEEEGGEDDGEEDDVKAEAEEVQKPAAPVKRERVKKEQVKKEQVKKEAPGVPVRSGWATFNSRPSDDVDMDDKFDVVG